MKKKAFALILTIVLFSTVSISQMLSVTSANPGFPWVYESSLPSLVVLSPNYGKSYPSSDIWLNFTVKKPSNWNPNEYCITHVAYCVDGTANGHATMSNNSDANEVIVEVKDPSARSFNFSFRLEGLGDGQHTLAFYVEGYIDGPLTRGNFGTDYPSSRAISFNVYTPNPTPPPTATPEATPSAVPEATAQSTTFPSTLILVASAGIAIAGMGLFVCFKKQQRNKSP